MLGRVSAAAAALIALTACAGLEPAGRNARSGGAPVMAEAPPPRPAPQRTLPPPQTAPAPQQQAAAAPPPPLQVPPAASPPPQQSAPQQVAALPPPQQQTAPPRTTPPPQPEVAAQGVSAPPLPRVRQRPSDEVVVPGVQERQVPPPAGDPRSVSQRMEDINAWDRCVTRMQASFESNPTRPQLETPEEVCSESLGMASRTAVPDSRIRR
ncbi:hypothetical protein [Terricaulis sp.]|uniref:hypothetical protein n=1 Tax=Terricaulis sp. TaxID=2768686 RepID=UPI0037852A41